MNQQLSSAGFTESYSGEVAMHLMYLVEERGYFSDEVECEMPMQFLQWPSAEFVELL
jgi:hypothetical protein